MGDIAEDLRTLGIRRDGSPEDRARFAALVSLMATYSRDVWTDESHELDWHREDVEEWIAEVTEA